MPKSIVSQIGRYPDRDQKPLETVFDVRRLFEASDKDAFLAEYGQNARAIATRGLTAHFSGDA